MSEKRLIQLEAAVKDLTKRMEKLDAAISKTSMQVTCGADAIADMADAAIADMKRYKPTIGVGEKPNP